MEARVHTKKGPIDGVIGRKAIHLMKPEERNSAKIELADLAVDIGAKDKKEAMELVSIGDPITYKLGLTKLLNDRIISPALDNKVGTFVVMEALRLAPQRRQAELCALRRRDGSGRDRPAAGRGRVVMGSTRLWASPWT